VADYLIHSMRGLQHEALTVIFLDAAHGIIDSEVVAEGTDTSNTVYPRELVKAALARNHPSGNLNPSRQDEELTRTLHLVCSFMHIRLLDHLIIGSGDQVYSFADQGIMAWIREDCRRLVDPAT